jgi:hypothetical protein
MVRQRAKNQPKIEVPPEACPQALFERVSPPNGCMQASDATSKTIGFLALCRVIDSEIQRRASLDPLLAPIATAFGPSEFRASSRLACLRVGLDRGPRAASGLLPLLGHQVVVSCARLVGGEVRRNNEGIYADSSCTSGLCQMKSRLLAAVLRPQRPMPPLNPPTQDQRDDRHQYHHPPHREASPCLGWPAVTPCGARAGFSISHYITVSSPSGGAGGRWSPSFRAFSTSRASGHPPATP